MVPKPQSKVAAPRKNGSGSSGSQRVPRRLLPISGGRFQSSATHGPLAVASPSVCASGFPQSPPDGLPQLPDTSRGLRPQQASSGGAFARAKCHSGPSDYLHSGPTAQGQRTRRKYHQRTADGIRLDLPQYDNQVYIVSKCL